MEKKHRALSTVFLAGLSTIFFALSFLFSFWSLQIGVETSRLHTADPIFLGHHAIFLPQVRGTYAAPHVVVETPRLVGTLLDPGSLSASSVIAKDVKTGKILYEKNGYDAHPIASISKLMSTLVMLERDIPWDTTTTVRGADSLDTHVYAGDTYTIRDVWEAALIGSSNKAILTLSSALGYTDEAFVARMNEKAHELGLAKASFEESTGLSDANVASASDVALLLGEALEKKEIVETLSMHETTLYSHERSHREHIFSTDWLMLGWVPHSLHDVVGKTGYIPAAGYNFAMRASDDHGHSVIVVVLGAKSNEARFTEARDVAASVFDAYKWPGERK